MICGTKEREKEGEINSKVGDLGRLYGGDGDSIASSKMVKTLSICEDH